MLVVSLVVFLCRANTFLIILCGIVRCSVYGISDPESDYPLPVFLLYLWASRCNLVGIQPIQSRLRLGCIATLPR